MGGCLSKTSAAGPAAEVPSPLKPISPPQHLPQELKEPSPAAVEPVHAAVDAFEFKPVTGVAPGLGGAQPASDAAPQDRTSCGTGDSGDVLATNSTTLLSSDGYPYSPFLSGPYFVPMDNDCSSEVLSSLTEHQPSLDAEVELLLTTVQGVFKASKAMLVLFEQDKIFVRNSINFQKGDFPFRWSFCGWARTKDVPQTMVVPDATKDARFADNMFVTGPAHIRFYAGAPLVLSPGVALGTLCFADTEPRPDFDATQCALLNSLAELAARQLDRVNLLAQRATPSLAFKRLARSLECYEQCVALVDMQGPPETWKLTYANQPWQTTTGLQRVSCVGRTLSSLLLRQSPGLKPCQEEEKLGDGDDDEDDGWWAALEGVAAGSQVVVEDVLLRGSSVGRMRLTFRPSDTHLMDSALNLPVGVPSFLRSPTPSVASASTALTAQATPSATAGTEYLQLNTACLCTGSTSRRWETAPAAPAPALVARAMGPGGTDYVGSFTMGAEGTQPDGKQAGTAPDGNAVTSPPSAPLVPPSSASTVAASSQKLVARSGRTDASSLALPGQSSGGPRYCFVTFEAMYEEGEEGKEDEEDYEEEQAAAGDAAKAPVGAEGRVVSARGVSVSVAGVVSDPKQRLRTDPLRTSLSEGEPGGARRLSSTGGRRSRLSREHGLRQDYASSAGRLNPLAMPRRRSLCSPPNKAWGYGSEPIPGLRLQTLLGKGGFGSVFAAEYVDPATGIKSRVAAKVVSNSSVRRAFNGVSSEHLFSSEFDHPNIVRALKCVVRFDEVVPSTLALGARGSNASASLNASAAPASVGGASGGPGVSVQEAQQLPQQQEQRPAGASEEDNFDFSGPWVSGQTPVASEGAAASAVKPAGGWNMIDSIAMRAAPGTPMALAAPALAQLQAEMQGGTPAPASQPNSNWSSAGPAAATDAALIQVGTGAPVSRGNTEELGRSATGSSGGGAAQSVQGGPQQQQQQLAGQGGTAPGQTCILLEYCDMGSLQDAIDKGYLRTEASQLTGRPHMPAILMTAYECASALEYLHKRSVVHGDVSSQNVLCASLASQAEAQNQRAQAQQALQPQSQGTPTAAAAALASAADPLLSSGELSTAHVSKAGAAAAANCSVAALGDGYSGRPWTAKVSDLGLSKPISPGEEGARTQMVGLLTHAAPEVLMEGLLSPKSDIYSLGVILWSMYTGSRPWAGLSRAQILATVTGGTNTLRFSPADQPPRDYRELASRCLSKDPALRPTASEVCEELRRLMANTADAGGAAKAVVRATPTPAAAAATTAVATAPVSAAAAAPPALAQQTVAA